MFFDRDFLYVSLLPILNPTQQTKTFYENLLYPSNQIPPKGIVMLFIVTPNS